MFCKNCGNQLPDNALFCGSCGTKVEAPAAPQQPAYEAPQPAPQQPTYVAPQPAPQQPAYVAPQSAPQAHDPYKDELAGSVLSKGIAGLALSLALGVPGIIVSAGAQRKAKEYESRYGALSGKAKVGSILSKVGLPVSIGMTVMYFLYIIILASAG